jgi:hypothetical protein
VLYQPAGKTQAAAHLASYISIIYIGRLRGNKDVVLAPRGL